MNSFKKRCGKTPYELLEDYITLREVQNERRPKIIKQVQPRPPPPPSAPLEYHVPEIYGAAPSTSSFTPTPAKEKKKTRGVPRAQEEDAAPPSTASAQGESKNTPETLIKLPSRGMGIVRALIYTASAEDVPQQIQWRDFSSTMARLGFQILAISGSSYIFKPSWINIPIHVHRPHPQNVIGLVIACRIGKRLTKRYKWTADSFEQE